MNIRKAGKKLNLNTLKDGNAPQKILVVGSQIKYRLKEEASTLNGYIFQDADHVLEWLSQDYIQEDIEKMSIEKLRMEAKICDNCGSTHHETRIINTYAAKEFKKLH